MSRSDQYSDDFDQSSGSQAKGQGNDKGSHQLKLSIDLLSVRNMQMAANLFAVYSLKLKEVHQYQSNPPTPVGQTLMQDTELKNCFASFDFAANKSELSSILSENVLTVKLFHQVQAGQQSEIGQTQIQLNKILAAPLRQTPEAKVRVLDDYYDIRDSQNGQLKGNLRVLIYLEDNGVAKQGKTGAAQSLQKAREARNPGQTNAPSFGASFPMNSNPTGGDMQGNAEYQAVWQLEMWKRAEEAKFKAYLKQREIEKIEEITFLWKNKEQEREQQFNESLKGMDQLDAKLRQKAMELQKREERIIQLEEELKHKITEVSRQLAGKEEEVINTKKRFKEEKTALEHDKKKANTTIEDLKVKLEQADKKFYNYKLEIEQSPLNVLRNELAQRQIDVVELETRANQANEQRDEYKSKYVNLQQQMLALKRQIDKEKEEQLNRQAVELEQIKQQLKQQAAQDGERQQIETMKMQLSQLQGKLTDQHRQEEASMQQADQAENPFATKNKYLDNYARSRSDQMPVGAGQSMNTPNYGGQSGLAGPGGRQQSKTQLLPMAPATGPKADLQRLKLQREELVQTGCYTDSDPMIQELDRQIASAQAKLSALV